MERITCQKPLLFLTEHPLPHKNRTNFAYLTRRQNSNSKYQFLHPLNLLWFYFNFYVPPIQVKKKKKTRFNSESISTVKLVILIITSKT